MKLHIAFAFILTGCLLHSAANAQIIKPTQIQIPDGPMCPSRVLDVDARRDVPVSTVLSHVPNRTSSNRCDRPRPSPMNACTCVVTQTIR